MQMGGKEKMENRLQIYNTLIRRVESFIPNEEGKVSMYTCGPTVYHFAHVGNLRSYIMEDLLEKSGLLEKFQAVQEGRVYCTTKNLYQSSMELGTIISDMHKMLTGEDDMTYLYRLE